VNIRLHGTEAECQHAVERLATAFRVVSVSRPYSDRGASSLVRVFVEVRLDEEPSRGPLPELPS
jgi:hypothetical protein